MTRPSRLFIVPSSDFPIDTGKRQTSRIADTSEIIGSAATCNFPPYAWTTARSLVASPEAGCHVGKVCAGLQAGKMNRVQGNDVPELSLIRLCSLTCRRRHIKCDENKPRCGPCDRISAVCAYSGPGKATRRTARHSLELSDQDETSISQPALAEDTTQTEGDQANQGSTSATQASSPPSGDNEEDLQPSERAQEEEQAPVTESAPREAEEHELDDCPGYSVLEDVLDLTARDPGLSSTTQGDATSWQIGCEAIVSSGTSLNPQNCYTFPQGHSEMLSPTQAAFQTAALAYHSTPDSGVNQNGSLTLRWLDLLIGDATLNYGPLPELDIGLSGPDVFGNTVTQTPTSLDEAATPATNDSSGVTTQSAYLQERLPDRRGPSGDKQFWQASEAIALQPQEHILFRHFTEHISRWVRVA